MDREGMAWAVALVGALSWLFVVLVADVYPWLTGKHVVPTTSPWTLRRPLFFVAVGMWLVSTLSLDGIVPVSASELVRNLALFFVFFNRAIVAGVGLVYAYWIVRGLADSWRHRRRAERMSRDVA